MNFKQWLNENIDPDGNYVAIKCEDLSEFLTNVDIQSPITGTAPPAGDYHCTLMYSKNTSKDPRKVMQLITTGFKGPYQAKIIHAECFDSIPEKGSRDEAKSCVVLELECPTLHKIHEYLSETCGLSHSYAEYRPHVTLYYNMSVEEAHLIRDKINQIDMNYPVTLDHIYSQSINEDYV